MLRLAANGAQFVLTGKASSIQRVSRTLKAAGVASSRIKAKSLLGAGQDRTGLGVARRPHSDKMSRPLQNETGW